MAFQKQSPQLRYQLTRDQSEAIRQVIATANEAIRDREEDEHRYDQLDRAYSHLCITLLDHHLHQEIDQSIVIGFFAVLGIKEDLSEEARSIQFHEAATYTPLLSAFIKVAQFLVLRESLFIQEQVGAEPLTTTIRLLHSKCIVYSTNSPVNWAQRMRALGKGIRETSTSLGHIIWSDDGEQVTYKELELTMSGLRSFLSAEIHETLAELRDLTFSSDPAVVAGTVPTLRPFDLNILKDNPSNRQPGWNFLKDPRNPSLHGHERFLLRRLFGSDSLREIFLTGPDQEAWRVREVEAYLAAVDRFLARLALLIHITGGQPGRGTELFSLQPANTLHGFLRNIFIENGMVSFVTFYHKGYSVSGLIKIIH